MKNILLPVFIAAIIISCSSRTSSNPTNSNQVKETIMKNGETSVDYAADMAIEAQTKDFLKMLNTGGGKPMETLSATEARGVLEGAQKSVKVDISGVEVSNRTITENGLTVNLIIVRPSGSLGVLPAFMFFHGGGWVIGDYPTHERFIRDLVINSGAVGIYVDYSRSPEAKYPVAVNEAYTATKWVAENGAQINVDGKRLAVVGNSAGGNIAAATTLMAKDKQGPEIKFQVLFWPVTNADFETTSYNQYANDRFLTKSMMKWFWDNYIPDVEDRNQVYASPLKASLSQMKGLPPALVQTAENDVLRDEGEAYARNLNEAGVAVTLVRYQGMIHDYGLLNPLAHIPEVQSALRQAANELKAHLYK
ncbi:alpha/beta hydrolase [Lacibacter sediminis]|uniref:Alpha/beta hydrolase n=1 Tax=Lacibacter sediminis TaxID=2760713 RepID=A0A7G5XK87_9BACT|nr:alpha/beta hydrolase [Lacibacter sediminis]QNA45890.1 alpha/beta hydrolase [Lacibacter sediminis]